MRKIFIFALLSLFSPLFPEVMRWESKCLVDTNDSSKQFAFIFIPKNGSSTFRKIVNTFFVVDFNPSDFQDSTKVLIVRDPLFRPISIYSEVLNLRFEKERTIHENFYINRADIVKSFKQFLHIIKDDFYEPHITHQHTFLDEKELSLSDIDFVLLFENLEADIKLFCKLNALPFQIFCENSSNSYNKKILKNLIKSDQEVRDLIYSIWEKDFELYEAAKSRRSEIFNSIY